MLDVREQNKLLRKKPRSPLLKTGEQPTVVFPDLHCKLKDRNKIKVLDLSAGSSGIVEYLSPIMAQIRFEDFYQTWKSGAATEQSELIELDELLPSEQGSNYDLVLVWDLINYLPPETLEKFSSKISQLLAPGSFLVLYLNSRALMTAQPLTFRLGQSGKLRIEVNSGESLPCSRYSPRAILSLFPSCRLWRSLRLRNGMIEMCLEVPASVQTEN